MLSDFQYELKRLCHCLVSGHDLMNDKTWIEICCETWLVTCPITCIVSLLVTCHITHHVTCSVKHCFGSSIIYIFFLICKVPAAISDNSLIKVNVFLLQLSNFHLFDIFNLFGSDFCKVQIAKSFWEVWQDHSISLEDSCVYDTV